MGRQCTAHTNIRVRVKQQTYCTEPCHKVYRPCNVASNMFTGFYFISLTSWKRQWRVHNIIPPVFTLGHAFFFFFFLNQLFAPMLTRAIHSLYTSALGFDQMIGRYRAGDSQTLTLKSSGMRSLEVLRKLRM